LFSDVDEREPQLHPLHTRRVLVDGVLASLDAELEAVYAGGGRPSSRLSSNCGQR
jgi:hypothetical protein